MGAWPSRSSRPSSRSSPGPPRRCRLGRRLGLRAQVGRLPDARLRRRRRRLPAVAQRQADDALLPRAALPRGPLRARRRDRALRRRRAARTSTRSASASTPPSRASACSPSRRRRASSPSTCSRVDDEVLLELPAGRAPRPARAARREARRPHARHRGPRRGAAVAAGRRGRDRQAPGRALPPGRAHGHGQDQARAHDRRRRDGLAARQGGEHGRLADPRPLRRRRRAAHRRPHLGPEREAQARAGRASSSPTRPASAAWATRAAGPTTATSSGSRCGRSWSSRSPSTTRATTASATATKISRWREDKDPPECRMEQLAS